MRCFAKYGLGSRGIDRPVLVDIEDAGAKLVEAGDLDHEFTDGRILWVRTKIFWGDAGVEVGDGGIVEHDPVLVDHKARRGGIAVFAVGDDVGNGLTKNALAQTDGSTVFEVEGIVEMLFNKAHHEIISIDESGVDHEPVVVAGDVTPSEQAVEGVGRGGLADGNLGSKEQCGCKGERARRGIGRGVESGSAQQRIHVEIQPGMVLVAPSHEGTGSIKEIGAQILEAELGHGRLLGEDAELPVQQTGKLVGALDAVVTLVAPKEYLAFVPVQLRTRAAGSDRETSSGGRVRPRNEKIAFWGAAGSDRETRK